MIVWWKHMVAVSTLVLWSRCYTCKHTLNHNIFTQNIEWWGQTLWIIYQLFGAESTKLSLFDCALLFLDLIYSPLINFTKSQFFLRLMTLTIFLVPYKDLVSSAMLVHILISLSCPPKLTNQAKITQIIHFIGAYSL